MAAKKTFTKSTTDLFLSTAADQKEQERKKAEEALIDLPLPRGYKVIRESKSVRQQVLLRPSTRQALRDEAKRKGISTNELLNSILEKHLEEEEAEGRA